MILDLGVIDYVDALKLQRELVCKRRLREISDSVLVVEHPAVFTIGRSGSRNNLLVGEDFLSKKGIRIIETDRGGDITFHDPGQLVVYPIIDLRERVKDLHKYLRELEEVIIAFLKNYDIAGERHKDATGVWVDNEKVAFIGVAAKDWITYHGLSININNDTKPFSMINPCGIKALQVTSLAEIIRQPITMYDVKKIFLREFGKIFGLEEMTPVNGYCSSVA
jgi:lipoyl(octanoyl) transferase